jgi:hypothetical protein
MLYDCCALKNKRNMKKTNLLLLGIMVMLAVGLRAQTQQRNWLLFQANTPSLNLNFETGEPLFIDENPTPLTPLSGRIICPLNSSDPFSIGSYFCTNSIYTENNKRIASVISSSLNDNCYTGNIIRKDVAIYDANNNYIYTGSANDGFEWRGDYSNEVLIVNLDCDRFHIITGYYIAELDISNSQLDFGNTAYNLLNEGYNKAGLNVSSLFRSSFAVKKLLNGDYYLYMYYYDKPNASGKIGFKVFHYNSQTDQIIKIQEETLDIITNNPFNRAGGKNYLAEIELTHDGTKIAYADGNYIYVRNILSNNEIDFTTTVNVTKFHDQTIGDVNAWAYEVAGIEFDAVHEKLYYSVYCMHNENAAINGVFAINLDNGDVDIFANTKQYARSQIELGRDNKLYITSSNSIARINNNLTVSDVITNINIPLSINTYQLQNYSSGIRTLPDQIDGLDYDVEFAANRQLCCLNINKLESKNYEINTNQTWTDLSNPENNSIIQVKETFTVKSGVRLNLNNLTIKFCEDAKMIVEDGAFVVADNTIFTSIDCDVLWEGIEVHGSIFKSQLPYQNGNVYAGVFVIKNSSEISNAKIGVRLHKAQLGTSPVISTNAGGVVLASNTIFKNNIIGINAQGYQNFDPITGDKRPNRSTFTGCTFTNDKALNTNAIFESYLKIRDVSGIKIHGCNFINDFSYNTNESGIGIDAIDAGFTVTILNPTFNTDPNTATKSVFKNLRIAVDARRVFTNETYTIEYSHFEQCFMGIINRGVNYAKILKNNFVQDENNTLHPSMIEASNLLDTYGNNILVLSGSGFRIEENLYNEVGDPQTSLYLDDIVQHIKIVNSGTSNNIVYKNTSRNAYLTGMADGVNRGIAQPNFKTGISGSYIDFYPNVGSGLRFLCNESNNHTQREFQVESNTPKSTIPWSSVGIAQVQANITQSSIFSAGNKFENITNATELDFHFRYRTPPNTIKYYWDNSPFGKPFYVDPSKVVLTNAPFNRSCPSSIDLQNNGIPSLPLSDQLRQDIFIQWNGKRIDYEKTADTLFQLIDHGSTQNLIAELNSSNTVLELSNLYQNLMQISPYLSFDFLNTLCRSGKYNNNQLMELLLANPDATQDYELLTYLYEEKPDLFSLEQIDNIRNSWELTTSRTELSLRAQMWLATSDRLATILISNIYNDTTSDYKFMIDSIINKQQLNEHVISTINNLLLNNYSDQLQLILDDALEKFESEPYAKAVFETYNPLLNVLKDISIHDTSFNYTQLSHHLQSIVDVAYDSELWPSIAASNLYYKITDSILPLGIHNKKERNSFSTTIPPLNRRADNSFQNQTASNKSYFTKIYTDKESITHISLENISLGLNEYVIYDMMGKKALGGMIPHDEKEISINIPPGNYIFVCSHKNVTIRKKFYVPHQ